LSRIGVGQFFYSSKRNRRALQKRTEDSYMETSLISAAAQGFVNLLHFKVFVAMLLGVSIGTFTAVAPQGLGMRLVYAISLPIVIKWEPLNGIALLIGASSVSAICAAYLPILFGIPGGSGSQATVLDGYPMGKRGEGRRALGASFMAGAWDP
jgi:putative tricarboxylic transport membrane protein